jgi:leucyl aminopeptidase
MCGAASVLGTMRAVAEMKLQVNLTIVVPAVENMPAHNASKPGVKRKISKTKTEVETKEKRKKYEKDKRPARTFNIKVLLTK